MLGVGASARLAACLRACAAVSTEHASVRQLRANVIASRLVILWVGMLKLQTSRWLSTATVVRRNIRSVARSYSDLGSTDLSVPPSVRPSKASSKRKCLWLGVLDFESTTEADHCLFVQLNI